MWVRVPLGALTANFQKSRLLYLRLSRGVFVDIAVWIILGLVVLAGIWLWATYNGLVTLKV